MIVADLEAGLDEAVSALPSDLPAATFMIIVESLRTLW